MAVRNKAITSAFAATVTFANYLRVRSSQSIDLMVNRCLLIVTCQSRHFSTYSNGLAMVYVWGGAAILRDQRATGTLDASQPSQ